MQYHFEVQVLGAYGVDVILDIAQRPGLLLRVVVVDVIDDLLLGRARISGVCNRLLRQQRRHPHDGRQRGQIF